MSEQEMNRISRKMQGVYAIVVQYMKTEKSGRLDVLKNVLCQGLGLSPRTCNEYLDMLNGSQIRITNNMWKWLGDSQELIRFNAIRDSMVPTDDSSEPDFAPMQETEDEKDKRMKELYRAKQE